MTTKFSPAFRDALREIRGTQNASAIRRALNLLTCGSNSITYEERAQIADEAQMQLTMLLKQFNEVTQELENLGNAADRDVEKLLHDMTVAIVDFPSANEAVNFYDLSWFQTLAMSTAAKTRIAIALIEGVKKYTTPANLWVRIQDHDTDALNEIAYIGRNMSTDILGTNV